MKKRRSIKTLGKIKLYIIRFFINIIVLLFLIGAGVLIFYVISEWMPAVMTNIITTGYSITYLVNKCIM